MAKQDSGHQPSRPRAATPALAALAASGRPCTVHEYLHDPSMRAFGVEAAQALELDPGRVFKTLVVALDRGLGVGVVPVEQQLSMKQVAVALGSKRAELADRAAAERVTGYVQGGISPLGQKRLLPTVIDESAFDHETIFVSGGRRGLEIELAPLDLLELLGAVRAVIA